MRIARTTILLALLSVTLSAQFNSAIQGTLTDQSEALIPGALVRITNLATGVSREVTSGADGIYRVLSLGPGNYRVEAEKEGFQKAQRDSVTLGISETIRVDFGLAVGVVVGRIQVEAQSARVETAQGRISERISQAQLNELPLNGRNVFTLIALQPGVSGRGNAATFGTSPGTYNDSFGGETGPQVNAAGQRWESNNYTIDDTSSGGASRGGTTNLTPSADSVEEIRVISNNFSAEDGRSPGAQIQVITKAGGNQFHGGVTHFFQNNTLSSRNLFEAEAPAFRKNQFTYNIGGPIVRNRLFFHHTYEGIRQSGARGVVTQVETPEFRDFVVRTRPNSIAAKLLSEFRPVADPVSNLRDLGSPQQGVNVSGPPDGIPDVGSVQFVPRSHRKGNQFSGRVDLELRPGKDRLYGSYYQTSVSSLGGGIREAFNRPTDELTYFGSLNHTHIFDGSRINEIRIGMNRFDGAPAPHPRLDIPQMSITGIQGFSNSQHPFGWLHNNFLAKDVFSWVRSKHSLKFGAEVRKVKADTINTDNYIPSYSFASPLDFADDEPLQMTRNVDPATGLPATNASNLRALEWAIFVNDDWKVRRDLTVTLGLRYENYGSLTDPYGNLRNLVPGPGATFEERLATAAAVIVPDFFPADRLNFAPRLGFAWDVGGKGVTAIRGGYGIAYDRIPTVLPGGYRASPPLRAFATLGSQFGTTFTYSLGNPAAPFLGYPVDAALRLGLDSRGGIRGVRVRFPTAMDPDIRSPYVHNWFLGVQRTAPWGMVVEVNYQGSAGHHLMNSASDVNRYRGDMLDNRFDGFNPSFSSIGWISSTSNSIYHGGTVQVRRAFRSGLSFQGSYTFGKAITDAELFNTGINYQDIAWRRGDRAVASYDVPQRAVGLAVWQLPGPAGVSSAWLKQTLGGWQLSGSVILEKGQPINIVNLAPWPRGDYNADNATGDRPNAPASNVKQSGWTRQEFLGGIFSVADFPTPERGTNGNLGRNAFRGPGFAQVDLSLSKRFRLTERASVQVRLDTFNALNRVNLANPVTDLNNVSFGQSTATLVPRLIQAGLRIEF